MCGSVASMSDKLPYKVGEFQDAQLWRFLCTCLRLAAGWWVSAWPEVCWGWQPRGYPSAPRTPKIAGMARCWARGAAWGLEFVSRDQAAVGRAYGLRIPACPAPFGAAARAARRGLVACS